MFHVVHIRKEFNFKMAENFENQEKYVFIPIIWGMCFLNYVSQAKSRDGRLESYSSRVNMKFKKIYLRFI